MDAIGFKVKNSQTGAVFAEFALVLPVLFILFVGLLELGRLFTSVSWLSQISYNAVLAAAEVENPVAEAQDAAYVRMQELEEHYKEEKGENAYPVSWEGQPITTNYDSTSNIITLRMSGSIDRLIDAFIPASVMPLNFNVNVAAPYFGSGSQPLNGDNWRHFAQPSEDFSVTMGGVASVGSGGDPDPEEAPFNPYIY